MEGVQDAFVGQDVVLHLKPGAKLDDKSIREALKKHKVTIKTDPKVDESKLWKVRKATS